MPDAENDWITVKTTDGPMRVFVARPAGPATRAVVVLQEAFGVNEHIQDVSRRVAEHGYLVMAPDLFHRTGPDVVPYDDHAQAMALISALGREQVTNDVDAVFDHLDREEGVDVAHTAVVGFCFGGRVAFTVATATDRLGAAVAFYGPGVAAGPHASLDRAPFVTAPLLMHVGADDPTIPAEHVDAIEAAMSGSDSAFELHVYPGAGHAFACDARPHMYKEQPARLAWERTYEFLAQSLPDAG